MIALFVKARNCIAILPRCGLSWFWETDARVTSTRHRSEARSAD
jgi:hypothetical protein